jgi:hypothetical protein
MSRTTRESVDHMSTMTSCCHAGSHRLLSSFNFAPFASFISQLTLPPGHVPSTYRERSCNKPTLAMEHHDGLQMPKIPERRWPNEKGMSTRT